MYLIKQYLLHLYFLFYTVTQKPTCETALSALSGASTSVRGNQIKTCVTQPDQMQDLLYLCSLQDNRKYQYKLDRRSYDTDKQPYDIPASLVAALKTKALEIDKKGEIERVYITREHWPYDGHCIHYPLRPMRHMFLQYNEWDVVD